MLLVAAEQECNDAALPIGGEQEVDAALPRVKGLVGGCSSGGLGDGGAVWEAADWLRVECRLDG